MVQLRGDRRRALRPTQPTNIGAYITRVAGDMALKDAESIESCEKRGEKYGKMSSYGLCSAYHTVQSSKDRHRSRGERKRTGPAAAFSPAAPVSSARGLHHYATRRNTVIGAQYYLNGSADPV